MRAGTFRAQEITGKGLLCNNLRNLIKVLVYVRCNDLRRTGQLPNIRVEIGFGTV